MRINKLKKYGSRLILVLALIIIFAVNTKSVLGAGLAGYWRMDENPINHGTAILDLSGNGNTGTASTGDGTLNKSVMGKVNTAMNFDGTNDYVSAPIPTNAIDNFTLAAWVNPATISVAKDYTIIGNGTDDGVCNPATNCNGYAFLIQTNILYGLYPAIAYDDSGYRFPSANQWYHVVMLRNSGTTKFYVNGVQTPNTFATAPRAAPTQFNIGSLLPSSRYFSGALDEVRVYNRALSDSEVTALSSTRNPKGSGIRRLP